MVFPLVPCALKTAFELFNLLSQVLFFIRLQILYFRGHFVPDILIYLFFVSQLSVGLSQFLAQLFVVIACLFEFIF